MATMNGAAAMAAKIRDARMTVRAKVAAALKAEMMLVLEEAKSRVPVDTGALRDSGRVEIEDNGSGPIRARITFGNETVHYAVEVHENIQAHHPRGGEAKYLESALNEEARLLLAAVVRRVDFEKS